MSEEAATITQKHVLICADENSLQTSLSFLAAGEKERSDWFFCCSGALEARRYLAQHSVDEIWVASSDEVEGINLGAALKVDSPKATVLLVGCEKTGSVLSRVHAASLDGTLALHELRERFNHYGALDAQKEEKLVDQARVPPDSSRENNAMGFLLSVVSGSGGAGKSTVSVLAALLAARRGLRVALLDADFQFGDLGDITGVGERIAADDLVLSDHWLEAVDNAPLVLVTAPQRLEQAEVVFDKLDDVLNQLLGAFDVVVANTGSGWDEQRLRLIERSTTALFLVDQRVSSVRACRHALDLCLRCGVATGSFLFAINRCHRHAAFTSIDVSSALQGAHVIELAEGGSEVEELMGAGMADGIVEAGNPLCQSIDALLSEVLPAVKPLKSAVVSRSVARVDLSRANEPASRRRSRRLSRKQAQATTAQAAGYPVQRSAR